jgi:hypothetical protein
VDARADELVDRVLGARDRAQPGAVDDGVVGAFEGEVRHPGARLIAGEQLTKDLQLGPSPELADPRHRAVVSASAGDDPQRPHGLGEGCVDRVAIGDGRPG